MAIIKYADARTDLESVKSVERLSSSTPLQDMLLSSKAAQEDEHVRQRFVKFAKNLKQVAPRAKDFLYFSCVMMHAAEASVIDQETGETIIANGSPLKSEWKIDDRTGSWKWSCSDPNIKPYKNNNGDIFPESELKQAYRNWIGRPLCKDHQSSSVDGIRGIIVDTYYDDRRKRVIALCALDKINYPDLARKVSTGYATNVSMGTAVGKSICFECGNVAKVESDYCEHVRNRTTYGEINVDLSPIELSLVVTGADPRAQLKNVIASLNKYSSERNERFQELKRAGCVTPIELDRLEQEINDLKKTFAGAMSKVAKAEILPGLDEATRINTILQNPNLSEEARKNLLGALEKLLTEKEEAVEVQPVSATQSTVEMGDTGKGYTGQANEAGPPEWAAEGNRLASINVENMINNINNKLGAMEHALRDMSQGAQEVTHNKEEQSMSDKELRERAAARRAIFNKTAYHLGGGGVNDPSSTPYPVDPTNDQLKTKGDKQMEGQGMEPGKDGMHPGYDSFGETEEARKKKLLRAERKDARHALLKSAEEAKELETKEVATKSGPKTVAKLPDGTVISLNNDGTWKAVDDATVQHARDLVKMVGRSTKKEAYWLGGGGVNEPQTYPVDPTNDKLKTDGDKQMEGQGMEPGKDGMHPGYQSYGDEKSLKEKLLRAQLRAKFVLAYQNEDKTVIDKENSRWEIYAGPEKILEATGREIYEDELDDNWDVLASKKWGREVLSAIRNEGLEKVAWYLKGDIIKEAQPPMPPMPGMEEELPEPAPEGAEAPEKKDVVEEDDPVKAALQSATEHLEEVEKALGDLEKAYEVKGGEKSDEAELDTTGISAADDRNYQELYAGLDESADELAMLAESLDGRIRSGQNANDPITSELLRLTTEAADASQELRKQASFYIKAKKGKKEEKEEEVEEKEDKKSKDKKESKKEDKKESKKEDKKESKKSKGKKDEDMETEEDKKSKKSKAELLVEDILRARAAKRRGMAKKAEHSDVALDEKMIEDIVSKKLEEIFAPLGGVNEFVQEEEGEEEHGGVPAELEVGESELLAPKADDEMDALDAELDQMLDDFEADDPEYTMDANDLDQAKFAFQRRAWREKVAADVGAKYQLSLDSQTTVDTDMPVGKTEQLGQLDISTDEAKVEGIVEMHEEILRQVQNLPKVREAMEHLGNVLKSGKLKLAELDNVEKLTALAVDPEAAKYWKGYFGEGDSESGQFGNELVKEFTKKKVEASVEDIRVKMSRAYDIALEMQEKGLIGDDLPSLHSQAKEIMSFDEKSFESFKRVLARLSKPSRIKTAAPALNVGISGDEVGEGVDDPVNLSSQLKNLFD